MATVDYASSITNLMPKLTICFLLFLLKATPTKSPKISKNDQKVVFIATGVSSIRLTSPGKVEKMHKLILH